MRGSPWLAVGIVAGVILGCAWIGWAIHLTSEHSLREALGALIAWAAIAAVVALISVPFRLGLPGDQCEAGHRRSSNRGGP